MRTIIYHLIWSFGGISMKKAFLLLLLPLSLYSQNKFEGVIIDEHGQPIDLVDIHNEETYTYTNEDGEFRLYSSLDSIQVQKLGFLPVRLSYAAVETRDTITLKTKVHELDEVVVQKDNQLILGVVKNLPEIYPSQEYNEQFFLRVVLRKNGKMTRLQDLYGKLSRKTLFSTSEKSISRNNYRIELEHMRKAGIREKETDFSFFSFHDLFTAFVSIPITPQYNYNYRPMDSLHAKLSFQPKQEFAEDFSAYGTFTVNKADTAIQRIVLQKDIPADFVEKGDVKYRTTKYDLETYFQKSKYRNKYLISKARWNGTVEVQDQEKAETNIYEVSYLLLAREIPSTVKVRRNVSPRKDIFGIDHDYRETFWEGQHQLELTQEMKEFLATLEEENREYKIETNLGGNQ